MYHHFKAGIDVVGKLALIMFLLLLYIWSNLLIHGLGIALYFVNGLVFAVTVQHICKWFIIYSQCSAYL